MAQELLVRKKKGIKKLFFEFVIPVALFSLLGMFGWRIRGTKGFGAVPGCVFVGSLWRMLWLYLSREKTTGKTHRYSTGWSFTGLAVGISMSGMHAWMQWRFWIQGVLILGNSAPTLSISPVYGYAWLFICAVPWCGMGAFFLAWSTSKRSLPGWQWVMRVMSGAIGGVVAYLVWFFTKQFIIPEYGTVLNWIDLDCLNCDDAIKDTRQSLVWLGIYAGFLVFEVIKRHWTNVKMIVFCGLVAGIGWCLLQSWFFGRELFPALPRPFVDSLNWTWFEWWAGLPFGLALGIRYYLWNRPKRDGSAGEITFRTPPGSIGLRKGAMKAELIFALDMILAVGIIFNLHSAWEGIEAIVTGVRPDFIPEIAIPALIVALIAVALHVVHLYRHPRAITGPARPENPDETCRYWGWIIPVVFTFTCILGISVQLVEEFPDFQYFWSGIHVTFLIVNLILLICWRWLAMVGDGWRWLAMVGDGNTLNEVKDGDGNEHSN
ncbi:MAG: hypothetical protein ACTSUE_04775 [Promethearchaeota archaeon]